MRLASGGLIDRTRPVGFTFDGESLSGFQGDTLASALLANDVRIVGRSFKYHRPRGVLAAGVEEPNALVTIGAGAGRVPNIRATVQEIWDGLAAESQNRWPSRRFDLFAFADLLHPLLGAGFYYKTFKWPPSFWERVYEPLIRRAAGLGVLEGAGGGPVSETGFIHCDLLVIGGGPAGLMAALTAARGGADVVLADEDARFGGRLLAESEAVGGQPGAAWAEAVAAELAGLPNVRLMARTSVTGAYDGGVYGAVERVSHHLAPKVGRPLDAFWRITASHAILAAGATERIVAFPGNDVPGVMLAGAVRAYLNRWAVLAGERVAVFAAGGDGLRTVRDLRAAGAEVVALVTPDEGVSCDEVPVVRGVVCGTAGRRALRSVRVRDGEGERRIAADCLAVSGGWSPNVHLTAHLGGRPRWDAARAMFLPPADLPPGMAVAGAANGTFGTAAALAEGVAAAEAALAALARKPPPRALPEAEDGPREGAPIWHVRGRGRAFLDLQNDVTARDMVLAAAEGMRLPEHAKRFTTQGMATDQGKTSNVTALAVLAEASGQGLDALAATTFRPPWTPVPIAAMGAHGRARGFAPERLTASHAAGAARGATMVEAGLWFRPAWFARPGETHWRASCDREVRMVRSAVGVIDVSTLGKIELVGPEVGAFLDFVYMNRISTLKPGRVRYGVMLREDGHVLDDGTVARLSDDRWVLTTTTAAADAVLRHLEFVHQVLRPWLRLRFVSVTEGWAQIAMTGPLAGDTLRTLPGLLDLPPMGCGEVEIQGVPGRLFRISFSGEVGYELAVSTRYGASLWRLLVAQGESMGGGPYGMEALNVLRIEKGYLTHAEMDGRTTASDLGLDRLAKAEDHIGRAMAARPGLAGAERQQLVGLTAGPEAEWGGGALIFAEGAGASFEAIEGRLTSACFSPTLGRPIALGLLRDGRARHGERVRVVDRMRGMETVAEVCDPVFYDRTGERTRG